MAKSAIALFSLLMGGGQLICAAPTDGTDAGESVDITAPTSLRPQFATRSIFFGRREHGPVTFAEVNEDLVVSGEKGTLFGNESKSDTFHFGTPTIMNADVNLKDGITSNGHTEWHLASLNTFDEGGSSGGLWTPSATSTCAGSADVFLGGHCKFGGTTASGIYTTLPSHDNIKVKARVHFFDKWAGQSVYMKVNDNIVWTKSWNACPQRAGQDCAKHGIDTCGHSDPDRVSVPLEIDIPHQGPMMALTFGSTINENDDPCVASWGIDDVAIYVK